VVLVVLVLLVVVAGECSSFFRCVHCFCTKVSAQYRSCSFSRSCTCVIIRSFSHPGVLISHPIYVTPHHYSQLQHAVSLLRTIERDYLWSEAVELVQATGGGSGGNASGDVDSLHTPTLTTSSGVVVHKLPVSPVLRDHIQVCIESVLPLLCTTSTTSNTTSTSTSASVLPKWADKLYTIADIHAYITTSTSTGYNILAINNVTQFSDYTPVANANCSTLLDGTTPRTRSDTITNATSTTDINSSGTSNTYSACDSVLALLEHYRVNSSALLYDTTDHILVSICILGFVLLL